MKSTLVCLLLISLCLAPLKVKGAEVREWILVEHFQALVYPTGERVQRGFPIAGPYQYRRHVRYMSCNRARLIISRHLTSEELQRVRCEPVMTNRKPSED